MGVKASAQVTVYYVIDIKAYYRYYSLQSSKPTKPTTYPPPSTWSTTEPSYTAGSTKSLYFVDCVIFCDDTFQYSGVSLSSSYEAAKDAYSKAMNVEDRIETAQTSIEQNKNDIALRATKIELNALVEGNLIVNGFGLNKDNYNFSQWTFNGTEKCDGFPSFKFTGSPRELYIPQYVIPIDISRMYEFRMTFKGDSSKKLYLGWDEFDIDGKQISATNCMGISASTTTLAQDLKDGDTVVHLTSTSGWTTTTATHQLGLIFWNYKDSTGYQYPVGVYSRNVWTNLYTSDNVNKTSNTITLKSAWNHGTFPAGTKVSQSNSSGHKYFNYTDKYYPAEWTETSYVIGGTQELYKYQSNKFNQAAKYMRFVVLHNYGGTSSSTMQISKITLRDVTLDQDLSNNYYTKTETDAKISVQADRITSAVSRISTNETAISTLEQTADGLTVRLDTADANVANAQTIANMANTTANSVKNDLASNYTKKTIPDTRSDNQPPSWYISNYPKQIITEFKNCSAIGLSGVGNYCTLQTIIPWGDKSGGYPKQTAKVETTGKEYWRVGTSESVWSSWIDPYATALNSAKTATNYLSFDSTNGLVVGDITASTLQGNVQIKAETSGASISLRDGTTILTKFSAQSKEFSGVTSATTSTSSTTESDEDETGSSSSTVTSASQTIVNNQTKTIVQFESPNPIYFSKGIRTNKVTIDDNSLISNVDFTLNGRIFDKNGKSAFEPITGEGNLSIGYGRFKNAASSSTDWTILYGNQVKIATKKGAKITQDGSVAFETINSNGNMSLGYHLYKKGTGDLNLYSGDTIKLTSDTTTIVDATGNIVFEAKNANGNTVIGYSRYANSGNTNIYGGPEINLLTKSGWIVTNCSITPDTNASFSLGKYNEKGWSNIYLGNESGVYNGLRIILDGSSQNLCGRDGEGRFIYGNIDSIMYYNAKNVNATTTGTAFKFISGNYSANNNTTSVWLFGAADSTSRYIGSYMAYNRTYSSAANMYVTANGVFGRSTSSSERYKKDITVASIDEISGLYELPIKRFKYKYDYIAPDDELYGKDLYGFIVEDLEEILPCAVQHIENQNGEKVPEMWNSNIVIPCLLKLIQDLNERLKRIEKGKEVNNA